MVVELLLALSKVTIASSVAVAMTLLMRRGIRAIFGARIAYGSWLLVPASFLVVIPPIPRNPITAIPLSLSSGTPVQNLSTAFASVDTTSATAILGCWAFGMMAMALYLIRGQWQANAAIQPFVVVRGMYRASGISFGPAVVGLLRPKIVVPSDFEDRYSPEEQALILRHEQIHMRRGDLIVSAILAAAQAVFWFNPLLHLAARVLRADQEFACDAAVLAEQPKRRKAYASALLKSYLTQAEPTIVCAWGWRSTHPLKERIMQLTRPLPMRARLALGRLIVATLVVSVACSACSLQKPHSPMLREQPSDENSLGVRFSSDTAQQSGNLIHFVGNVVVEALDASAPVAVHSRTATAHADGTTVFEGNVHISGGRWTVETDKTTFTSSGQHPTFKMADARFVVDSTKPSGDGKE